VGNVYFEADIFNLFLRQRHNQNVPDKRFCFEADLSLYHSWVDNYGTAWHKWIFYIAADHLTLHIWAF
jgi:hypothetical protein